MHRDCTRSTKATSEALPPILGKIRLFRTNVYRLVFPPSPKLAPSNNAFLHRNLAFCPFTPFIVILGTAILNTDHEDMNLLSHVVESLEKASRQAPGATKLYNICKILLKGAKACIEQSLGSQTAPTARQDQAPENNIPNYGQGDNQSGENAQVIFSDTWEPLHPDHLGNMSTLFDNYLAGSASLMPMLEGDLTQFDMMESPSDNY